eukprot:3755144-Pleurochrysis_carterae.AAC.1
MEALRGYKSWKRDNRGLRAQLVAGTLFSVCVFSCASHGCTHACTHAVAYISRALATACRIGDLSWRRSCRPLCFKKLVDSVDRN